MRTVYVIALEGAGATGCDWYDTAEARTAMEGKMGAEYEVHFAMEVDDATETDAITEQADEACWDCAWRDGPFKVVVPVR